MRQKQIMSSAVPLQWFMPLHASPVPLHARVYEWGKYDKELKPSEKNGYVDARPFADAEWLRRYAGPYEKYQDEPPFVKLLVEQWLTCFDDANFLAAKVARKARIREERAERGDPRLVLTLQEIAAGSHGLVPPSPVHSEW